MKYGRRLAGECRYYRIVARDLGFGGATHLSMVAEEFSGCPASTR
jgi:hypothetical protein